MFDFPHIFLIYTVVWILFNPHISFYPSVFSFFVSSWYFLFLSSKPLCCFACNSSLFNAHLIALLALTVRSIFTNCIESKESVGKYCNKLILYNFLMSEICEILEEILYQNYIHCHSHLYYVNQIDI